MYSGTSVIMKLFGGCQIMFVIVLLLNGLVEAQPAGVTEGVYSSPVAADALGNES